MSGFSKSCKFIGMICVVAAGVSVAYEIHGENAYLPTVGSPPLRFQVVTTNYFVFSSNSAMPAPKPGKTRDVATALATPTANPANISNSISNSSANTNQTSAPQAAPNEENNSQVPIISTISSSSASDLLTVTPQMITEYLKPAQTVTEMETNQPVVFVPAEMQFAPPAPKNSSESRATYKTQ